MKQIGRRMITTPETREIWKEITQKYAKNDESKDATSKSFDDDLNDSAELFYAYSDTTKLREFLTEYGYMNLDDNDGDDEGKARKSREIGYPNADKVVAVTDGATSIIGNSLVACSLPTVAFYIFVQARK